MYIMHDMSRAVRQAECLPPHSPGAHHSRASLASQIASMRRRGMSATAIRRALGLSCGEALRAGILDPLPARPSPAPAHSVQLTAKPRRTMAEILDAAATAAGVERARLLGPCRARDLVRPRQLCMLLLRRLCPGTSLPAIGFFLRRDHTTVLYGIRRAEALLARDPAFRALHAKALRQLAGPADVQG
jgi:hypothetical protein